MDASEALMTIPAIVVGVPVLVFGLAIASNVGRFTERRTRRNYAALAAAMPTLLATPPDALIEREIRLSRIGGVAMIAVGMFLAVVLPMFIHGMSNGSVF
jgi:hypothetical protein